MADIRPRVAACPRTFSPSIKHAAARSPLAWVRRRARRLQRFYAIDRREAVANAWDDWAFFRHTNAHAGH